MWFPRRAGVGILPDRTVREAGAERNSYNHWISRLFSLSLAKRDSMRLRHCQKSRQQEKSTNRRGPMSFEDVERYVGSQRDEDRRLDTVLNRCISVEGVSFGEMSARGHFQTEKHKPSDLFFLGLSLEKPWFTYRPRVMGSPATGLGCRRPHPPLIPRRRPC